MPVYEYRCKDCKQQFEMVLTFSEHDQEKVSCPNCGGKRIEQQPASFFEVTESKNCARWVAGTEPRICGRIRVLAEQER
jgi:putative FmdB family regulatory protein